MSGPEEFLSSPGAAYRFMQDLSKRWLAHDGLWFQAVEGEFGMAAAIEMDAAAWDRFTVLEAGRIRRFFGLPENGGLSALRDALQLRLYRFINEQEIIPGPDRLLFRMRDCRVQSARTRKGLPDFPCKPVGLVEYAGFARAVDPRITTRCVACPPDDHPADYFCAWEFNLPGAGETGAPAGDPLTPVLEAPERALAFVEDLAKRWMAHDGLWFRAIEGKYGLEMALALDAAVWQKFTVLEAARVRNLLQLPPDGGLFALQKALPLRLDYLANRSMVEAGDGRLVLRTPACRVQTARRLQNLPPLPCQTVGLIQHEGFARAVDSRISTRRLAGPPREPHGCVWEFSIPVLRENLTVTR